MGKLFSMRIYFLWEYGLYMDLFDNENHSLIPFDRFRERGATENDRLCWIVLTKLVKHRFNDETQSSHITCGIIINDMLMDIKDVKQKNITQLLSKTRYEKLKENDFKVRNKVVNLYNLNHTDWSKFINKMSYRTCQQQKSRNYSIES